MLRPKNISSKRAPEPDHPHPNKKSRNSRKSLKISKKQPADTRQSSPVHIMKQSSSEDEPDTDHGNFIACINGYLSKLDYGKPSSKFRAPEDSDLQSVRRRINKQKEINRNMQRDVLQFQRILWERTEKLDRLEDYMRRLQAKQNDRNSLNAHSHAKSRPKLHRKPDIKETSSEFENMQSDYESSEVIDDPFHRYSRRRRTQMPSELEKMISKTMALLPDKYGRRKV